MMPISVKSDVGDFSVWGWHWKPFLIAYSRKDGSKRPTLTIGLFGLVISFGVDNVFFRESR